MRKVTTALAILALIGIASPSRADLIIEAPTVVATPGQSGSFDLLIYSTGGSYQVAADTIQLSLTGPAGVSFTGVSIATTAPYLYTAPGVTNGGGPFSTDPFPNTNFLASDSEFGGAGYVQISPGTPRGIAHVTYAVNSAASLGNRSLILGAGTSLSDINFATIPFTANNGAIRVVPEPMSLALLSGGLLCTLGYVRRRFPHDARGRGVPCGRRPA
ncbi:MAG: PEP-CTERM sorting domain-containing protein [Isosphaeraceae bacterium]